jgi:anti-sigma factor RsiW
MSGSHSRQAPHLTCDECQHQLQDYLDGTLARRQSMRLFLHLRECQACGNELERLQALVGALENLPAREPPADFDTRILASVPYEQYRAMAGIRAERVPVFLEPESLPAWVRARATLIAGGTVAVGGLAVRLAAGAGDGVLAAVAVGLAPLAAVGLQAAARRVVVGLRQARQEG